MLQQLKNIGFSEKEAGIYLVLTKKGEASAPTIAYELDIERRTVYDVLNGMYKKGWVSKKKVQNVEMFTAVDASLIAEEIYSKYLDFKKIVPDLKKKETGGLKVNVLYGKKAIQHLVSNALQEKKELLLLGRGGYLIEQLGEEKHQYVSKLNQLNWKMIQTEEYKNEEFKPKDIRFLPKGTSFDTAFLTFSDKVYLFSKEEEILVIEIKDKAFSNTYKKYFELFWGISSKKNQCTSRN